MILFDFDYERADTLEEAVALLARLQGDARALAGGTDLLPSMRMENIKPGLLVSLSAIEPAEPQVLEVGPLNATIHKLNECIAVADLDALSEIYRLTLVKLLVE